MIKIVKRIRVMAKFCLGKYPPMCKTHHFFVYYNINIAFIYSTVSIITGLKFILDFHSNSENNPKNFELIFTNADIKMD